MIQIRYETLSDFADDSEVSRYVWEIVSSFSEWVKHLIIEERRVTTGNSGLVLNKRFNPSMNCYEIWFSLDQALWEE